MASSMSDLMLTQFAICMILHGFLIEIIICRFPVKEMTGTERIRNISVLLSN